MEDRVNSYYRTRNGKGEYNRLNLSQSISILPISLILDKVKLGSGSVYKLIEDFQSQGTKPLAHIEEFGIHRANISSGGIPGQGSYSILS